MNTTKAKAQQHGASALPVLNETENKQGSPVREQWHVSRSDHFKAIFDHLKHISTLATGSILLLATFLEKLFRQPNHPGLVSFAIAAFLVSVVASIVAYGSFVMNFPRDDREFSNATVSKLEQVGMAGGLMLTWLSFICGVGAVAIFFWFNWNV